VIFKLFEQFSLVKVVQKIKNYNFFVIGFISLSDFGIFFTEIVMNQLNSVD